MTSPIVDHVNDWSRGVSQSLLKSAHHFEIKNIGGDPCRVLAILRLVCMSLVLHLLPTARTERDECSLVTEVVIGCIARYTRPDLRINQRQNIEMMG
jgi:hypothetical protein